MEILPLDCRFEYCEVVTNGIKIVFVFGLLVLFAMSELSRRTKVFSVCKDINKNEFYTICINSILD